MTRVLATRLCRGGEARCGACHSCRERARRLARLAYPERQPCETCGEPDAERAHYDYSEPLRIRWLCTIHHAEWDAGRRFREGWSEAEIEAHERSVADFYQRVADLRAKRYPPEVLLVVERDEDEG